MRAGNDSVNCCGPTEKLVSVITVTLRVPPESVHIMCSQQRQYFLSLSLLFLVVITKSFAFQARPHRWIQKTSFSQRSSASILFSQPEKQSSETREDILSPEERTQFEIENMVNQPCTTNLDVGQKTFDADRMDSSLMPIPMFTGLVVLLISIYVTGYMFYVGINGFPEDSSLPRVF